MSNPYGGNPYGGAPQQPSQPYAQQQPAYAAPAPAAPPPAAAQQPGTFVCPKCRATMRTYNRNGIQIEQCDSCRGIFLDFGELESLTRLEGNMGGAHMAPPAAHGAYGAGWSSHGSHHYRPQGFTRLFFST